jgi:hypothetical protein
MILISVHWSVWNVHHRTWCWDVFLQLAGVNVSSIYLQWHRVDLFLNNALHRNVHSIAKKFQLLDLTRDIPRPSVVSVYSCSLYCRFFVCLLSIVAIGGYNFAWWRHEQCCVICVLLGPKGCPETSVRDYHYTLRNIPEKHISHLLREGSPNSRTVLCINFFRATEIASLTGRLIRKA